jgi:nitrate/nitrite transport system substrate-binding protein
VFDDPFDGKARLDRSGCRCGRHRSTREHDAAMQLQCVPAQSDDQRYEGSSPPR